MANETENAATLLAKKDYAHAVPLLKREHEKYQNNPRIRLQYADALAGNGDLDEAMEQYEATAKYYEDNGLTVQAIAVRKKSEKVRDLAAAKTPPKSEEITGNPRTPTITASKRTELLRLDKEKLDNALSKHPGIRKVLDEFYRKRAKHTVEAMIESLRKKG